MYIELISLIDLTIEQEIWSFLKSQLCFMPFLKNIKWKFPYIKK